MSRHLAPLTALILFTALPFSAAADIQDPRKNRFCEMALKDPVAFVQRSDFERRLRKMSDDCPELALALTDAATGSIPGNTPGYDGKGFSAFGPDFTDLIARLGAAKQDVEDATDKVASARKKLEGTIRHAKSVGISDDDLDAISPIIDDEDDVARLLPSYTGAKRDALENFIAARDRLASAQDALDDANRRAEPLVRAALELSGQADAARGNLSEALGDMSAADRQALLDAAVNAANQALADVQSRLAQSRADLQAAIDRLNETYNSDRYQNAHLAFSAAKNAADRAEAAVEEAREDLARAEARADNCRGHSCHDARRAVERAQRELRAAQSAYDSKSGAADTAWNTLKSIMDEMQTWEQQQLIAALTEGIIADEATEASADEAARNAVRQARELADLIAATATAIANAEAASEEARAATATEAAEVVSARAALEAALEAAQAALAGSEEERAALAAVQAAKAELQAALEALGAAQDVAEDLAEEVADIPNAPDSVTDPAEALETADAAGDSEAEAAEEAIEDADAAVADYNDANDDLSDALGDDSGSSTETTTDTTESAPEV